MPSGNDDERPEPKEHEAIAARVLAHFVERYRADAPFAEDRERAEELALEARPIVDVFLATAPIVFRDGGVLPLEHHESLALLTLLGRRSGMAGITPTALLAMVDALFAACAAEGVRLEGSRLERTFRAACLEGYVAGKEESLDERASIRAARSIAMVSVAPRCLALFVAGLHEPARLRETAERFGRWLLESDAMACIVDLSALEDPSPDRAGEVFSVLASARLLGVTCVFAGVSEEWRDAARHARVPLEDVLFAPTFEAGLVSALGACGVELRRTGWLSPLRALLERSPRTS